MDWFVLLCGGLGEGPDFALCVWIHYRCRDFVWAVKVLLVVQFVWTLLLGILVEPWRAKIFILDSFKLHRTFLRGHVCLRVLFY